MTARYFVTGLGGTGKSLVARALAQVIPGAALVDLEHRRSLPDAIWHPINSLDDWITMHDRLADAEIQEDTPVVLGFPEFWSLPAASRVLGLEAMAILTAKPVWVVGRRGSADVLSQALERFPGPLHDGLVVRNRYFDLAEYQRSPVRGEMRADGYSWRELDIPALHQLLVCTDWSHPMARLFVHAVGQNLKEVDDDDY